MNIQRLGLVDKRTSANREVQYRLLTDFPDCLEYFSALSWNFHNLLD